MPELNIQNYGTGHPIVWLHGWGFDSQIWSDILPHLLALPSQYQIFLVDLPGFGSSSCMSWSTFKSTLLSQLPTQFTLLGWSLGGLFATRLASEEPQRVSHLLQVTSSPYFLQTPDWKGIAPDSLNDFYQRFISDPEATRQQFIQAQVLSNDFNRLCQRHPINLSGLKDGLQILTNWDLRSQLIQLNMPVAYLFGRLDRIVPYSVYAAMQMHYPQFHYTLFPKSGHMPFLSHKEDFLNWLEETLC